MYRVVYTLNLFVVLQRLSQKHPGIGSALQSLSSINPLDRVKTPSKTAFGDYYVKAGNRYCITMNINHTTNIITLLQVIKTQDYHKLLTDWNIRYH